MMSDETIVGDIRVVFGKTSVVERFDAVVVVLFLSEELVMVKNRRRGWEFPGGRREGTETYAETATREVLDETGAEVRGVRYLGYYTTKSGHTTVITCAEVSSFEKSSEENGISCVGIFERLPPDLSFADGREQLFLDRARVIRSTGGSLERGDQGDDGRSVKVTASVRNE